MAYNPLLSINSLKTLNTVQTLKRLQGDSQETIATQTKIRSAADDAIKHFKGQNFEDRYMELSDVLSDIGLTKDIVGSAMETLDTFKDIQDNMKAVILEAKQVDSGFKRSELSEEYNELIDQLVNVIKDSIVDGVRLFNGDQNLELALNEEGTSKLVFEAIDFLDIEGGVLDTDKVTEGVKGSLDTTAFDSALALSDKINTATTGTAANVLATDDVIEFDSAGDTGGGLGSITITDDMTVGDFINEINTNVKNVTASYNSTTGVVSYESAENVDVANSTGGNLFDAENVTDATKSGFHTESELNNSLFKLEQAIDVVKGQSSKIGRQVSVLNNREEFTMNMITRLKSAQSGLVMANMELELQTYEALKTGVDVAQQTHITDATQRSRNLINFLRSI